MRRSVLLACFALAGCSTPVAGGLVEDDANRVLVSLDHAGVDAQKEVDPTSEGRFRVMVQRDDAARAVSALREDDLPPRQTTGVLDAMGKSSLVPSAAVEHAQYAAGLAGDLERTLATIDGVVSARVHVSLPPADPFGDAPKTRATASVLVKFRGATPPLEPAAVQRLVAGAVSGMRAEDVSVVAVSRPAAPVGDANRLAHVGPISVARGSASTLRVVLAGALVVVIGLTVGLVAMWRRLQSSRASEARA
jgi:type III secretion protein J